MRWISTSLKDEDGNKERGWCGSWTWKAESSHHYHSFSSLLLSLRQQMWSSVIFYLLLDCPWSSLLSSSVSPLLLFVLQLWKPDSIPRGRLQSPQTNPAPAKKAQPVPEILSYLYSRGKLRWHCSKALFNLLQSDRGSRQPNTHNAAPQV